MASLSQGRTAAAQCGLFTHKSVPVIFEPPCSIHYIECISTLVTGRPRSRIWFQNIASSLSLLKNVTHFNYKRWRATNKSGEDELDIFLNMHHELTIH